MKMPGVEEFAGNNAEGERHHELEAPDPSLKEINGGLCCKNSSSLRNAAGRAVGQKFQHIEICVMSEFEKD